MIDLEDQPEEVNFLPDEPVRAGFLESDVDDFVQVPHHRLARQGCSHCVGVQARVASETLDDVSN